MSKSYSFDKDIIIVEKLGVFENIFQQKGWVHSFNKLSLEHGIPIQIGLIPVIQYPDYGDLLQKERLSILEHTYDEYERQLIQRGRSHEVSNEFKEILKNEDQNIKIENLIHFRIYTLNQMNQEIELGSFEVIDLGINQHHGQVLTFEDKLNQQGKNLLGRVQGKRLIEVRRLKISLGHDPKLINLNLIAEIIAQHFYYLQLSHDTEIYIESGPLAKRLYSPMGFQVEHPFLNNKFIMRSNVNIFYSKFNRWVLDYQNSTNLCTNLFLK